MPCTSETEVVDQIRLHPGEEGDTRSHERPGLPHLDLSLLLSAPSRDQGHVKMTNRDELVTPGRAPEESVRT